MKKVLFMLLSVTLIVSMLTVGCAPAVEQQVDPAAEPADLEFKWPDKMVWSTLGLGTWSYALSVALATEIEAGTGMAVLVIPEESTPLRHEWLVEGKTVLASQSNMALSPMIEAVDTEAVRRLGPQPYRWVWVMQSTPFGFAVRGDSPIQSIHDITKDTRIAYWTGSPGYMMSMDALLAWLEIPKEEATLIEEAAHDEIWRGTRDGKWDVNWGATTSTVTFEVEAGPHGIRWLPLEPEKDPEGAARFLEVAPVHTFGTLDRGVESAIGVPGVLAPFMYIAMEDADEALIYNIAKWLHENFDLYKEKHAIAPEMSLENQLWHLENATYLPVHDGVRQYLIDIGVWTEKMQRRHEVNLYEQKKWIEAYQAAIAEADGRGIKVDPAEPEWLKIWDTHKQGLPRFGTFAY